MKRTVFWVGALVGLLLVSPVWATSWTYPLEQKVTEAYNAIYGTTYSADMEGLLGAGLDGSGGLVGARNLGIWDGVFNTNTVTAVLMMIYDTSETHPFGVWHGAGYATFTQIFDPGPWTSPSRNWITDPNSPGTWSPYDLAALLGAGVDFMFGLSNGTKFSSGNAYGINGMGGVGDFFIAYNNPFGGDDQDYNEPLIYVNPVPIPGAVWLLGSGMLGLVCLRRRFLR